MKKGGDEKLKEVKNFNMGDVYKYAFNKDLAGLPKRSVCVITIPFPQEHIGHWLMWKLWRLSLPTPHSPTASPPFSTVPQPNSV